MSFQPENLLITQMFCSSDCGETGQISMWYQSGCYDQVENWFEERLHIVGVVGIVVAVIQVCNKFFVE